MNNKDKVLEVIENRIKQLKSNIEHFERYGRRDIEGLQKNIEYQIRLDELILIENHIKYAVMY